MLRENVLGSAPCINIHPSLLPKYRGPSPIRSAIYNGDTKSGVCLMDVISEMDAGDIRMCREFDIGENETNDDIESRVSKIGSDMLVTYLANPSLYPPVPQKEGATFTRKFTGSDEVIDWSRPVLDIHNLVRALGAGRTKINGIDVKILETRIKDGKLEILRVHPAGKKPMEWRAFVNGLHGADIKFGE
jgi:methionyl-tRNA formyltransferase